MDERKGGQDTTASSTGNLRFLYCFDPYNNTSLPSHPVVGTANSDGGTLSYVRAKKNVT